MEPGTWAGVIRRGQDCLGVAPCTGDQRLRKPTRCAAPPTTTSSTPPDGPSAASQRSAPSWQSGCSGSRASKDGPRAVLILRGAQERAPQDDGDDADYYTTRLRPI